MNVEARVDAHAEEYENKIVTGEEKKVSVSSEPFIFSFQFLCEGGRQASFSYVCVISYCVPMMVSCFKRMRLMASFHIHFSHSYAAGL